MVREPLKSIHKVLSDGGLNVPNIRSLIRRTFLGCCFLFLAELLFPTI
jgi:hypothetical protein